MKNLDKIIPLLQEYGAFCEQRLDEVQGVKLSRCESYYMTILLRNGISTNTLLILLPYYSDDNYFKLPISLVLRSINSDYLSLIYLSTFALKDSPDQKSLENELMVFDKDLLGAIETFAKEEYYFNLKYAPEKLKDINSYEETKKFFHLNYPEFYKQKDDIFTLKTEEELRETSLSSFFKQPKDKRQPITERNKLDRVKTFNEDEYVVHAYLAFKYYSQYQHSSPLSKKFLEQRNELDNKLFIHTIENLFIGTQLLLKLFHKKDEVYLQEMKDLQNKLLAIAKE